MGADANLAHGGSRTRADETNINPTSQSIRGLISQSELADLPVGLNVRYRGLGSTSAKINPSRSRIGIRAVDVGNPMLAMHSCREMAGTGDYEPMMDVLTAFYLSDAKP